jgi:signal transduction histidine kinase
MNGTGARARRWSRWPRPRLADAALGLGLAGFAVLAAVLGTPNEAGHPLHLRDILAISVAFLTVLVRRAWALPGLVVATAAEVAYLLVNGVYQPVLVAAAVVLAYTTASGTGRRPAWSAAAASAVAITGAAVVGVPAGWATPENAGVLAVFGMATALGDAMRSRRGYLADAEERARRAEQTRDQEAQRRVAEERLRIARELHDVVAHHIAVITVQAGAAVHLLEQQPEQVHPALAHIRQSADAVLKELGAVVGVLRQPGDPGPGTEPTRGLARLPHLLDSLAAAGLTVDHRQRGDPRELPAVVDLAAYRIAQEALTNAQKYGTGWVGLTVQYTDDGVEVDVVNRIAPHTRNGGGFGLVGMRERAAAAGGTLTARSGSSGQFTVHAVLPAPRAAA